MLNSMYSEQTRKYGVVDLDENDFVSKTVVPFKYRMVDFQKYGIISYNFDGTCNAHLFDGTTVCCNAINPLFLSDNLLIFSNATKKCYILDFTKEKPVLSSGFDTILFFMGSNPKAIPYSANFNLTNYLKSPDYIKNGAHLEELVGARNDNAWGVINRKTNQIYADFNNRILVQCAGSFIVARNFDGVDKKL